MEQQQGIWWKVRLTFAWGKEISECQLSKGVRGDDVKWLQSELNEILDERLNIDGIYGEKTEQAVRDFQTKVFVDGIVGELTLKKLSWKLD